MRFETHTSKTKLDVQCLTWLFLIKIFFLRLEVHHANVLRGTLELVSLIDCPFPNSVRDVRFSRDQSDR